MTNAVVSGSTYKVVADADMLGVFSSPLGQHTTIVSDERLAGIQARAAQEPDCLSLEL